MSRESSSRFIPLAVAAAIFITAPALAAPLFQGNSIHYTTRIFAAGSAVGDFDGDGHLDFALVVSNNMGPSGLVQTGRGHGDGTFDPVQTLPGGVYGDPVAADLNGDGFSDLAVSGQGGLAVHYGGPTGLGSANVLATVDLAQHMDVVDLNGDGRLDLVTANGTNIVTRLATGATTYAPDLLSPTGLSDPVVVVVQGDIDEDFEPDLLIQTSTSQLAWMKGNGDGTFGAATPLSLTSDGYDSGLFLADLNGDHHLDAVGLEGWSLGDGHGNFGPPVPFPSFIWGVADVTGDGAPDLVAATSLDGNASDLQLWRNDGAGNFTHTWSQPAFEFDTPSFGDFNGDGLNDVLAPDEPIGDVSVHLSNGDGTFGKSRNYKTGNKPSGIVLAEVTGDGRLDAVTSNQADGTISVLPGLAGGQFDAPITYSVGSGPNGIATGDLNGDGRADIVTADGGSSTVSVLLGQPGGGLGSAMASPTLANPVALALGDINRDGRLDAAVVNANTLAILHGDGSGHLALGSSYSIPFPAAGRVVSVAVGDLDGNGWPDVVVGAFQSDHQVTLVFRGDGTGGLLPPATYTGGRALAIADVTGDGIPDVLTQGRTVFEVLQGIGGGAPTFVSTGQANQGRAIAVADRDGDGKLDVFVAADLTNCVWFVKGLGGGAFAPAEGYGVERSPTGLVVADLDGDGTLDVVTSDSDTNLVSVLLGVGPGPVPALASLVSAEATGSGVHIEWLTGASEATVERSESGSAWTSLGPVVADASGRLLFEDHDVKAGADYAYRLGFAQGGQTVYAGLVSVHVPAGASLSLAAGSNPAQGALGVSFTLPDARPARLELYDVAGRRLISREVGAMGAGAHILRLDETSRLASGIYWLRLVHPERTLVARAAVVR